MPEVYYHLNPETQTVNLFRKLFGYPTAKKPIKSFRVKAYEPSDDSSSYEVPPAVAVFWLRSERLPIGQRCWLCYQLLGPLPTLNSAPKMREFSIKRLQSSDIFKTVLLLV